MVDRQNGQSVAQAEQELQSIEQQVLSSQQQLSSQEASLQSQFVPGTIEAQFRLQREPGGAAVALGRQRQQFEVQREIGLSNIATQRQQLAELTPQIETRRVEIGRVRSAQEAEATRQSRISNVLSRASQGKTLGSDFSKLSKADQNILGTAISEAQDRAERTAIRQTENLLGLTLSQASREELIGGRLSIPGISAINPPQIDQSFARPEDLSFPGGSVQSFASLTDFRGEAFVRTPSTTFTQPGDLQSPRATGGLLTISQADAPRVDVRGAIVEGPPTRESFVSAPERGAIIGQFTAPTRDPFVPGFLGPSQEFIQTERTTAREAQLSAEFVTGRGRDLTESQFTEGLGGIRSQALLEGRQQFDELSDAQRGRAFASSVFQVPTRLGSSTTQFGAQVFGALGQQTPGQLRQVEFSESTLIGQSLSSPFLRPGEGFTPGAISDRIGPQALTAGVGLGAALIVGGRQFVSQVREVGAPEAFSETLSIVSPLRLQTTILTPRTTAGTELEGFGTTLTRGRITERQLFLQGVDDPISVNVFQESIGAGSSAQVITQRTRTFAPAIRIVSNKNIPAIS